MSGRKPLRELDGEIFSRAENPTSKDMLWFTCPICTNGHGIAVTWEPPSLYPSGAIWSKTGETVDDITIHPSISCEGPGSPCTFHGWVKNGVVTW